MSQMGRLHEAILAGDREKCFFLIHQGEDIQLIDGKGFTLLDLAAQHHPELLDLFFFPHLPFTNAAKIFTSFSQFRSVSDQFTPCIYQQNTDDFGIEITQLLMSKKNQPLSSLKDENSLKMDSINHNMQLVCKILGIDIKFSMKSYHLRDLWMKTSEGEFLNQNDNLLFYLNKKNPEKLKEAISRAFDYLTSFKRTGYSRSNHPFLKIGIPGNISDDDHFLDADEKAFFENHKKRLLAFCGDGGNVLKLTNRENQIKILIGEFQFFTTLNIYINEKNIIEKAAATSFSQFLIKKNILEFKNEKIYSLAQEMHKQGLLKNNEFNTDDIEKLRITVATYAWQKTYVQGLIGSNYQVSHEDVIIIPQIYYHLDNFLKSGPHHSILINSHELCIQVLEEILKNKDVLQLTQNDLYHLENYFLTAKQLDQDLNPLFLETSEILEKAGFNSIPSPGIFMYDRNLRNSDSLGNFNFLNALSGWSAKNQNYYYLTTGAQIGDRLGLVMMDVFNVFLKKLQPNIEVYFLGRNPQDLNDFHEPMVWWNTLLAQFGIHCLTIELKTNSHIDEGNLK